MADGTVCKLNEDGVLIGKRSVSLAVLQGYSPAPDEVVFMCEVDNDIRRYRWNGVAFIPVSNDISTKIQSQPDLVHGIMKGFKAIIDQGLLDPVPPELVRAVNWYNNSFDGRGR